MQVVIDFRVFAMSVLLGLILTDWGGLTLRVLLQVVDDARVL